MSWVFCHGLCYGCGRVMSFNPNLVPSIAINEVRRPICQDCVTRVNPLRIQNGLALIVPLPGSYEPCDQRELVWDC